jgi:hypothetical protein
VGCIFLTFDMVCANDSNYYQVQLTSYHFQCYFKQGWPLAFLTSEHIGPGGGQTSFLIRRRWLLDYTFSILDQNINPILISHYKINYNLL